MIVSREAGVATTADGQVNLENSTLYYWRVIAYNNCFGEYASDVFTFGSKSLSCETFIADDTPLVIPSAGTPTVNSIVDIESSGSVTDMNVKLIKGNHTKINTLRASIVSPAGTTVVLWEGECTNTPTINAGFDDESAFANDCPNFDGKKMRAKEQLSSFIGESIEGNWSLKIEDIQSANGGTLSDFELELCSDVVLNSPYVVNNVVLEVLTGSSNFIEKEDLLCQDDNNSDAELLYTLVTLPTKGYLSIDDTALNLGDQFTQAEINEFKIKYNHTGITDTDDTFVFTLIDGEGGWIEKTNFIINMSADGDTSVEEPKSTAGIFDIYPNPTSNIVHISKQESDNSSWSYSLLSLDGKLITRSTFKDRTQLDLSQMTDGVYYIHLNDGKTSLYKKIIKAQ